MPVRSSWNAGVQVGQAAPERFLVGRSERQDRSVVGLVEPLERYLAAVPAGPSDREIRALLDDARRQATTPTSR